MSERAEAGDAGGEGRVSAPTFNEASRVGVTAGRVRGERVVLGCGLVVVVVLFVGGLTDARRADGRSGVWAPASDDEVLERVRSVGTPDATGALIDSAALLAAAARDPSAAMSSARALVDAGRRNGDPRAFGLAEAALTPWLGAGAPSSAYVLRAAARGGRHDFDGARADLDRAVAVDARDAQAWLSRGVLASVRGDVVVAMESCEGVARAGASFAAGLCDGHALGLVGRLEEATQRVSTALARFGERASAAERSWARSLLGELWARRGDALKAEHHLRAAMADDAEEPTTRIALADLLLDLGRDAEAHALTRPGSAAHEGLALRRAVAEARLGMQRSTVTLSLGARFAEARAREDETHLREAAWFELEVLRQPRRALRSALGNFRLQREPIDARLLLTAAHAARAPSAAAPALEWLEVVGFVDRRLAPLREALRTDSLDAHARAPRASQPVGAPLRAAAAPRRVAAGAL